MPKEVIVLALGQGGVQLNSAVWELMMNEHHITPDGFKTSLPIPNEDVSPFFEENSQKQFVPRCIMVDLEPTVLDEVRTGIYKNAFHPDNMISSYEDAANNFARGFFTVGKLVSDTVAERIRKVIEASESPSAFFLIRSLGGGTGSGLTSAMFDYLVDYSNIVRFELPIYPSPTLSTSVVEPYNAILCQHFSIEDVDCSFLLDNEALYDVVTKYLTIGNPTYNVINRVVAMVVSSLTVSLRYESMLSNNLMAMQTNLVPYPRVHFPLVNYAPFMNQDKFQHVGCKTLEITRAVFEKDNQLVKCEPLGAKYIACSLLYRGACQPDEINRSLQVIKNTKSINFVEWCPTGFKVGICPMSPVVTPSSGIAPSDKSLTMVTNTSCIGQAIQRLCHKFHMLHSKRSFVHWFVGEGMEESEFTEGLYNISTLVKDYEEICKPMEEFDPMHGVYQKMGFPESHEFARSASSFKEDLRKTPEESAAASPVASPPAETNEQSEPNEPSEPANEQSEPNEAEEGNEEPEETGEE